MIEQNTLYNQDCILGMKEMADCSVDFTLTDIPYDAVNRDSNGLRNLNKGKADIMTFDLEEFLREVTRVTKNNLVIWCGYEQFSKIVEHFRQEKGTIRTLIWEKTNPSPMNGEITYLSGVEMAVWFRKANCSTFNAYCKNTVFRHPSGSSKYHPTEKNHNLLRELILDNSKEGEIVFDPCAGSGSTLIVAKENGRNYLGFELDKGFYEKAKKRIKDAFFEPYLFHINDEIESNNKIEEKDEISEELFPDFKSSISAVKVHRR